LALAGPRDLAFFALVVNNLQKCPSLGAAKAKHGGITLFFKKQNKKKKKRKAKGMKDLNY
jgi:hypothetical protein